MMTPLEFYATQSSFTNPGVYARHLDRLPADIKVLCQVVQSVYLHYNEGAAYGYQAPVERMTEINLRYVRDMLARIFELDDRPLGEQRSPDRKLVSYCGSASTMLCALARSAGMPIRKRVGFARYFAGYRPSNHEVAEYWDAGQERWKLADPHLDSVMIEKNQVEFDVLDVPRDQYMVAGLAWQQCRAGRADPQDFGIADFRGYWMVRNCLIKDLAALNKVELLDWDNYGWCLKDFAEHTEEELALLDHVAELTQAGNQGFPAYQALFQSEAGLAVPRVIMSFSPTGTPAEIQLDF